MHRSHNYSVSDMSPSLLSAASVLPAWSLPPFASSSSTCLFPPSASLLPCGHLYAMVIATSCLTVAIYTMVIATSCLTVAIYTMVIATSCLTVAISTPWSLPPPALLLPSLHHGHCCLLPYCGHLDTMVIATSCLTVAIYTMVIAICCPFVAISTPWSLPLPHFHQLQHAYGHL